MPKLSKKLTNVIKVSGKSEKIEEFINKIKENVKTACFLLRFFLKYTKGHSIFWEGNDIYE